MSGQKNESYASWSWKVVAVNMRHIIQSQRLGRTAPSIHYEWPCILHNQPCWTCTWNILICSAVEQWTHGILMPQQQQQLVCVALVLDAGQMLLVFDGLQVLLQQDLQELLVHLPKLDKQRLIRLGAAVLKFLSGLSSISKHKSTNTWYMYIFKDKHLTIYFPFLRISMVI